MKKTLLYSLFAFCLFGTYSLYAQTPPCTSFSEATLEGDTICVGGTATVKVNNTITGKMYQAYIGNKTIGNPVTATGSTVLLLLPSGRDLHVGSHVISLRSSDAICNSLPGGVATVLVNAVPDLSLKVTSDTICTHADQATLTIQGTKPGEIYQAYQGTTTVGSAVESTGGTVTLILPRTSLQLGINEFSVQVSVPGCGTLVLIQKPKVVVNIVGDIFFSAKAASPICNTAEGTTVTVKGVGQGLLCQLLRGTTLLSEKRGTGADLVFDVPMSALTIGANELSVRVQSVGPQGCGVTYVQQSVSVVVNAQPIHQFTIEKDTIRASKDQAFVEVVVTSSLIGGVLYSITENNTPVIAIWQGDGGKDTILLPISSLSVGTHLIKFKSTIAGCGVTQLEDSVVVIITPSIVNNLDDRSNLTGYLQIGPNPLAFELHLHLAQSLGTLQVKVNDALGHSVYEQEMTTTDLVIPTQWPTGIYFLELNGEGVKERRKLVK